MSIRSHQTPTQDDLTTSAQCARLLTYLEEFGPIATTDCRDLLSVMSPAARVMELRKRGCNIETIWRYVPDASGVVHRQGVYRLALGDTCHE